MGGDGGVVATNRKYMRGAGAADHTGDYQHHKQQQVDNTAREIMTTCAWTKEKLKTDDDNPIVACSYGRLYQKEAIVQALLQRKQQSQLEGVEDWERISHIRRLSDLHSVHFHFENDNNSTTDDPIMSCPITNRVFVVRNSGSSNSNTQRVIPAILLVPGKEATPNIICESAISQLSKDELEEEYGPIQERIRLAPPEALLKEMKEVVRQRQALEDEMRKKNKKKKKKRKRDEGAKTSSQKMVFQKANGSRHSATLNKTENTTAAKRRVETAIQSNKVLSSLFTTATNKSISEKEHKDNLFAR